MRVALLQAIAILAVLGEAPAPAAKAKTNANAGERVVLWLGPFDAGALDAAALLQAVAVYTRDLNLETRIATDVPAPGAEARAAGVDAAAGASVRTRGARLGFWCEPAPDRRSTALIIVDADGRLAMRAVESAALDGPELYRAIALKLRAVLAATIGPEAPPTEEAAAPTVTPSGGASTPAATPAGPVSAGIVVAPPATPSGHGRFFGVLGYRVSTPFGSGSIQQGAAAEAGARIGRAGELALGVALQTRTTASNDVGTVAVFDLPLELEARFVHRGRLSWGGGGFAAAHFLWATATDARGAEATPFAFGGGVGFLALARGPLGNGVAAEARLSFELAVPSTTYWVTGAPILELGSRLAFSASLVFPSL
jgi:hypothetical protein